MSDSKQRPGCFRIGCCGCLLLFGLFIASMVGLAGMQALYERDETPPEQRDVQRDLPTLSEFRSLVDQGELGEEAALETSIPRFETSADLLRAAEAIGGVVRVELDLNIGEFDIVAADPGEGLSIESRVDERAFRFVEEYLDGPDGPILRIHSFARGGMLGMVLRGAGNNPDNRVTIRLPRETPFDLIGLIGLGESRLELGGLLLRTVDLELGTGEHSVRFGEPLAAPLESIRLRKSIGDFRVSKLGNASPSFVDISQRIGETYVDLHGAWRNDAEISLRNGIGELNVEVPRDVRVDVHGGVAIGERNIDRSQRDLPDDAPRLDLTLAGTIGEVTVDR